MANSAIEHRNPGRRAGVLAAAAALLLLTCSCAETKKIKGPLLLHPAPPTVEQYTLAQGALVFSGPGFTVTVRPWDYRLVAQELRDAGQPSPFGDSDEEVGSFIFFRVRFENGSAQTLVFNPLYASLQQSGEGPKSPIENSDLFAFAGDDYAAAEVRSRTFRKMSFDVTASVRPGASVERYLVFRSPKEADKQFVLKLDELWLGSKGFNAKFLFEAFPGK